MTGTLCLAYACLGGICTTLGVNVLQYKKHLEQSGRHVSTPLQDTCSVVLNFLFSGLSIVFFVLATGYGPVSIAMPVLSGTCLLSNMVVQISLGIEHYSKSMRVGTWVLVFAIVSLVDIGPKDQTFSDPLALLLTISGSLAMVGQLVLMILSMIAIASLRAAPPSSMPKIFAFAFLVATSTVVSASVGKLMQMDLGSDVRILCIAVYITLGAISFVGAAAAASETDGSTYLPVRSCVQLLLNAVTGLGVWEDWRTVTSWTAYTCVYILIVLGVYEVSSFDMAHLMGGHAEAKESKFSKAARHMSMVWEDESDDVTLASDALRNMLADGLHSRDVKAQDLLELTMRLVEAKHNAGSTEVVKEWAQELRHFKHYYDLTSAGLKPKSRNNLYRAPTM